MDLSLKIMRVAITIAFSKGSDGNEDIAENGGLKPINPEGSNHMSLTESDNSSGLYTSDLPLSKEYGLEPINQEGGDHMSLTDSDINSELYTSDLPSSKKGGLELINPESGSHISTSNEMI